MNFFVQLSFFLDGAGLQLAPLESDSTVCLSANIQFGASGKELLLMNEDLLQDLVLYKKSHEKAVSIAVRSLITLLRELKNDSSPVDIDICARVAYEEDEDSIENDGEFDNEFFPKSGQSSGIDGLEDDAYKNDSDEEGSNDGELANANFVECLNVVDASPRSLKRLVVIKAAEVSTDEVDGIVSNEDFQRIKELKAQIRSKLSKQERVAFVRAGRGDREKNEAKTLVKQRKGELSNRHNQH
ncbi:hypothetical protein HPP92_028491 [Vanilla planifolia]|uniref:Protein SDA1 n=1 Tax=Vanilla planifolia TaxID=51239 RepID=A0A835U5Q0_VANPL|nr:hypothetical protein HPP92_028491 [Vanilla planifolia]